MNGLCDTCSIKKKVPVDDGYGSVSTSETVVVQSIACRKSRRFSRLGATLYGESGRNEWRFSTDPVTLEEVDSKGCQVQHVIYHESGVYDVTFWQAARDETGKVDHIEFTTERR